MKRYVFLVLCILVVFSLSSQNLHALIKPFSLYISGGVVTDDSLSFDPFNWTAGVNMDFSLGPLMLSPEVFVVGQKFEFDKLTLAPAVIVNFKLPFLFVGAGLTKWVKLNSDFQQELTTDFSLKINAGIKRAGLRLTAFVITALDNLFSDMTVGATAGFGF
jgi:hypothetical protein